MYWFIYSLSVIIFGYLVSIFLKSSSKRIIIYCGLVILFTPAQIEIGSNNYAPALFTFIFNSLLEQDYSLRVLRPIFLSLPISLLLFRFFILFRKKVF